MGWSKNASKTVGLMSANLFTCY